MFDRLIGNIEYYLNPINLIKGIINFILRRDILQIIIFYSAADYINMNGFLDEYLYQFELSFDVLQRFVFDVVGFNIFNNAFFLLAGAILLESYKHHLPSSIAHITGEIICPILIFVSLWALSGNIVFALGVGLLKHISAKGYYLNFLEANNQPIYYF